MSDKFDGNIFKNGGTYFFKFTVEDREKALAFLAAVLTPASDRTEFEKQYGITGKEIGWVDWQARLRELTRPILEASHSGKLPHEVSDFDKEKQEQFNRQIDDLSDRLRLSGHPDYRDYKRKY